MGVELGRISGPLLTANLLRHGTDLAFETELVYISVEDLASPSKVVGIGVNTDTPNRPLTVNGTTSTTNLLVDTALSTPEFFISSNRIQSTTGIIFVAPFENPDPLLANPTISTTKIGAGDLRFSNRTVENITANSDIILFADGDGKIIFTTARLEVANNLHATGEITLDGNIIFGSDSEDSVTFSSDIASNIVPDQTATYTIGTDAKQWNNIYADTVDSDLLEAPGLIVNSIDLLLTQGNTYYVSVNGLDTNVGDHLHNTFKTIKYALSVATVGDEIVIFPGTYTEEFPLTVPQGVTVKGAGIRSVTVEPTIATNTLDCFLLNGETTVGFLTVQGFYAPGYAFKLAPGYSSTIKSPYIYNVSVITRGSVITLDDPLGFDQADAGGGAYIDGSVAANTSTNIPTMLFTSTTFIVPNAQGIVATNRARVEWLNSFTYFAETGIRLETGTAGFASEGKTRITMSGIVGPVAVGDLFSYLSNDDLTVIATGTVSAINGSQYTIDGFVGNLVTIDEIQPVEFISINNATLSTSQFKFGNASLLLTGTNYISGPDSFQYNLASNNFCIECWIYPTEFPSGDATIIGQWGTTALEQSFNLQLTNDGGIKLLLNDSQSTILETGIQFLLSEDDQIITDESDTPIISENSAVIIGAWQHVAVIKSGSELTLYIDGVEKRSITLPSGNIIANARGDITVGHSTPSAFYFTGYIDEVRISNNVSRYTSEFTPPVAAYTSDADTALLLHFDGINGSQFFVDDSDIVQNIVFTNLTTVFLASINGGDAATTGIELSGGDAFTTSTILSGGDAATSANATARAITALDYRDFAAEMRSINSANVYGTKGAVADGRDTLGYLVGHNFGYIGTGANSDNDQGLVVQANEVVENNYGTIYYDSVDHRGDYRVGDIFYVNQSTGQVTFDAQALDFSAGGTIVLEGPTSTTIINAFYIQTGNLRIYDNNIDSLGGVVNFAAFNGVTTLNTDVSVTGNLEISNNFIVDGDIFLGDNPLDTITIVSALAQSILPNANDLDIGSTDQRWDILYANLLDVDGVLQLTSAEISVLTGNTDLRLVPNGAGSVIVASDLTVTENVIIGNDLEVLGTSSFKSLELDGIVSITGNVDQTTGDLDLTGNLSSVDLRITGDSYFYAPDIKIYSNVISVESTNEDLIVTANGTGGVIFDSVLKITGATISNVTAGATTNLSKSIILEPNGVGNVEIDSDKSLAIPAGSNTNRTMASNGEIRFNTAFNSYEGFNNTGTVSFNNITDSNRNTTITPETVIGADTDALRFTTNSVLRSFVDSTKLFSNSLTIDTITIANNVINSSLDLEFVNAGTGSTVINDVAVKDGTLTNEENTAFIISSTPNSVGRGHVKFSGDAVVFPYGPTEDRRTTPEVGEIRVNSTLGFMEVYSGVTWIPAVGTQGAASQDQIQETLNLYALVLG